jgi:hypothetical protein
MIIKKREHIINFFHMNKLQITFTATVYKNNTYIRVACEKTEIEKFDFMWAMPLGERTHTACSPS